MVNKNRIDLEELLETGAREVTDVDEDNGLVTLNITVKKHRGEPDEMVDDIDVTVPYTIEGLCEEYGEDTVIKSALRPILADRATDHRKNVMISEKEKQQKMEKDKKKVAKKVQQLKDAGMSEEEIKELLE